MSLQTVREAIAAVVEAMPEMAASHVNPPETLRIYPTSWVNPVGGDVKRELGAARWRHRVELIVYVTPRLADLPTEMARIDPLVYAIEAAFWVAFEGTTFPGQVSKCLVDSYLIGIRDFAGDPYHSVTFTLNVEETTL